MNEVDKILPKLPSTDTEFIETVSIVSGLIDAELAKLEQFLEEDDLYKIALRLPKLAVYVQIIRAFREDFLDTVSNRSSFQRALYANQDFFEERIYNLLSALKKNQEWKGYYQEQFKLDFRDITLGI